MDTCDDLEEEHNVDFMDSFCDFRRGERTAITKFIQTYEILPCLWNKKDSAFNNSSFKAQAYKHLVDETKKLIPNVNVEWVKNKIQALRTVFFRDYKKVVDSLNETEVYSPTLWYFELMLFVTEIDDYHVAFNNKIREKLKMKVTANKDINVEISEMITETEKAEYRKAMTEIIGIYKVNPCLWNYNNKEDYRNKELRAEALKKMVKCAQDYFLGVNVEWVKNKMFKLRSVFWREYEKKEKALAAGQDYTPTLWYYNQMSFLINTGCKKRKFRKDGKPISNKISGDTSMSDLSDACNDYEEEEKLEYNYAEEPFKEHLDEHIGEKLDEHLDTHLEEHFNFDPTWNLVTSSDIPADMNELLLSTVSSHSAEPSTTIELLPPPAKKTKTIDKKSDPSITCSVDPPDQPVMIHLPELNQAFGGMDELSAFATSIAAKLRRMSPEQRDLAELEIGRILFLGLKDRLVDGMIP